MVALRSHFTDDKSLLQFKKGDIIKVMSMDGLEPGNDSNHWSDLVLCDMHGSKEAGTWWSTYLPVCVTL